MRALLLSLVLVGCVERDHETVEVPFACPGESDLAACGWEDAGYTYTCWGSDLSYEDTTTIVYCSGDTQVCRDEPDGLRVSLGRCDDGCGPVAELHVDFADLMAFEPGSLCACPGAPPTDGEGCIGGQRCDYDSVACACTRTGWQCGIMSP